MPILHRLSPRAASVEGALVRRLLPKAAIRKVGPWVFVDHFGPVTVTRERGMDVRPHPHCGLSTVSYLFDGAIEHRDSVGGHAIVRPGEIHWMRAGHGIVHSERTPVDHIGTSERVHGLQLWCAHPDGAEDQEPAFGSWTELPTLDMEGVAVDLLAGDGWGERSPVDVTSTLVYAVARLKAGESLPLPDHAERCVYPIEGRIAVDGEVSADHEMLVVVDRAAKRVVAVTDAQVAILGGDPIGPRHMWWNLVHSDPDRLQEQADRWRRREFPPIPGDDEEFVPAPDGPVVRRRQT